MRTVKVHPEKSINFTEHAKYWCELINLYKRCYPDHTFKQIAKHFNLSEVNTRRYFYGIHHEIEGESYSQMRQGAAVTL